MQHCLLRHKSQLRDIDLYEIWDRLCDSGQRDTVFYGREVRDHHQFRDFIRSEWNDFFAVFYDGEMAEAVWLNDIRKGNARVHGFVCKEFWGRKTDENIPKSIIVGRFAMASLVRVLPLDVLYGFIPCWNKLAIKFSKRCGGVEIGTLPYGVWTARTKKSEDAIVMSVTRESTEESWTRF